MKINDNAILGLDIGSAKICAIICEIDHRQELHLKGVGTSVSAGIHRGKIIDIYELQHAISKAIFQAERIAQMKSLRVITTVPLFGLETRVVTGLVSSMEENGQISLNDKIKAIEKAKNSANVPNKRVLHIIPLSYKVDNTRVNKPEGVFGTNLEVKINIVYHDNDNLMQLRNALHNLNLQILGLVFDPLASSQIFLSEEDKNKQIVLVDIGGRFSKFSLFSNNVLQKSLVIPIGGETLTNDIAYCLKITIPEAERLKMLYANPNLDNIDGEEIIEINTKDEGRKEIKRLFLCQITHARIQELLKNVDEKFNVDFQNNITIKLAGAGSQLQGIRSFLAKKYQCEVQKGIPEDFKTIIDKLTYPSALGLIIYGVKKNAIKFIEPAKQSLTYRLKRLFR
jgi:cell division protein FtsA